VVGIAHCKGEVEGLIRELENFVVQALRQLYNRDQGEAYAGRGLKTYDSNDLTAECLSQSLSVTLPI
jgi:hypothetical protein